MRGRQKVFGCDTSISKLETFPQRLLKPHRLFAFKKNLNCLNVIVYRKTFFGILVTVVCTVRLGM